jgi:TetR/AcrR family acrAB operon transcriptional repressor
VRKTKDASEATRRQILAAARAEFAQRGVTRTTLEQIARAAGVTRGAIYWHFSNKRDLFNAMREQVILPLVDRADFPVNTAPGADALEAVEAFMRTVVHGILTDRNTRETFEILSLKCEYVDELRHELTSQAKRCGELLAVLTRRYREADRAGILRPGLAPEIAALESCAFLIGLFRLAFMCGSRMPIAQRADVMIAAHVAGRRGQRTPSPSPRTSRVGRGTRRGRSPGPNARK